VSVLLEQFRTGWRRHALVPRGGRIVVAVSGGVDSVVLLRLLQRLVKTAHLGLIVAHANHQLREAAEGDEQFVQRLAEELGLRCFTDRLPVREEMARTRESVEMVARRLRHGFLARVAAENAAGHIALAHHADDQAELFFLRLLRGAGGEGLGGMKRSSPSPVASSQTLIRPLLDITKAELQAYAASEGLSFREDASNQDRDILRNRVRHELLPLLVRGYSPGIREHVRRTGEMVAAEAEYIQSVADRWLKAGRRVVFPRLHVAVQRAVIRKQLWELGNPGDFELIERLRRETAAVMTASGVRVSRRESGQLSLAASPAPGSFLTAVQTVELVSEGGLVNFGGARLRWRLKSASNRNAKQEDNPGVEQLDAGRVGGQLHLRHWRPGDRFQPLGFPRPARLQNLFVNRKIPAALRRQLLVAEAGNGDLCWVEGLPSGETFKLTSRTRRILVLKCQRDVHG
jgi:tRNA(Ile)-lysidine synthase